MRSAQLQTGRPGDEEDVAGFLQVHRDAASHVRHLAERADEQRAGDADVAADLVILDPPFGDLVRAFPKLGRVRAVTRNAIASIETQGVYPAPELGCAGIAAWSSDIAITMPQTIPATRSSTAAWKHNLDAFIAISPS